MNAANSFGRPRRILFLTSQWPDPPQQGGTLRSYHLLSGLARRHKVDLLAFGSANASDSPLRALCGRAEAVPPPPPRPVAHRLRTTLLSLLPDMALRCSSNAFHAHLRQWLQETAYDIVQVQSIEMGPYLLAGQREQPSALWVFDDFNVEYRLQWRAFQTDGRQPRRWPAALYSLVQTVKLRRYEAMLCHTAGLALAVSEGDAEALRRLAPGAIIAVVPNGVDSRYFQPVTDGLATGPEGVEGDYLVFTGKMDFRPNVDGLLWFVQRVWPLLRKDFPQLRLFVVGQSPHPRLASLGRKPGIVVTGAVPDVRPYVAGAAVCIVPLRIGGGTRLKVLEAMAMGKAVVSTTLGSEGYPLQDGVHLRLADTPAAFARAVAGLLRDPAERWRLGTAAQAFAATQYDWSLIVPRLESAYCMAMDRKGP